MDTLKLFNFQVCGKTSIRPGEFNTLVTRTKEMASCCIVCIVLPFGLRIHHSLTWSLFVFQCCLLFSWAFIFSAVWDNVALAPTLASDDNWPQESRYSVDGFIPLAAAADRNDPILDLYTSTAIFVSVTMALACQQLKRQ